MAIRTFELLQSLLEQPEMTPDELDELLKDKVKEDLFLDYKHGDKLKNRKEANAMMREYVGAFANSAGGVLIVGVDQKTWGITGCGAPGGGDLREWAARCVTPIASYLSPPPRFYVVEHRDGDVLVVATARSIGLVPCTVRGKMVYYLRMHDQTIEAPEYLAADLVLGRRQRPFLYITDFRLDHVRLSRLRSRGMALTTNDLLFRCRFTVENGSLAWAEDVRLGIISWNDKESERLSGHLLANVDVRQVADERLSKFCYVYHDIAGSLTIKELRPFDAQDVISREYDVPFAFHNIAAYDYIWRAAIYLMSKEAPPVWYQVDLTNDQRLRNLFYSQAEFLAPDSDLLEVERLSGERPTVALDGLRPAET